LTGAYTGLTSATTDFTVSAAAVPATKLAFFAGAPQSLTVNVVSPTAIVIQRQDASNAPVSSGAPLITVGLSSNGAGVFYSDATGTTAITSIDIAAGSSNSGNFYYKATAVGTGTHRLTGAYTGLTSATTDFTVSAASAVATKLVYTAVDSSVQRNHMSTVFTVQRQDQNNNPTTSGSITLDLADNTGSGTFYSDSTGNNPITTLTISAGSSSANFYWEYTGSYSSNGYSSRDLTASSTGLTTATTTVAVTN
jgi:hypothetical protein